MHRPKGLTLKDQNWINSKCRSIARLEGHGAKEKFLGNELYMLGVYAFRQFHKAGMPDDFPYPSLSQVTMKTENVLNE